MSKAKIFISYSHKDVEWKDLLVRHLSVLAHEGHFDIWADDQIATGEDWLPTIERAMAEASVAILLISVDFLTSPFILGTEVPRLLERRHSEGMWVIPVLARPAAWEGVKWLSSIQSRPRDGQTLSAMLDFEAEQALKALAMEVRAIISTKKRSQQTIKTRNGANPRVAVSHLPVTGRDLFGRDEELVMLDKVWEDPNTHILVLVGPGGLGKSSLVSEWRLRLSRNSWGEAANVYDWSFYDQGPPESASADQFIIEALQWFGDPNPADGTAWDKGSRLAERVGSTRTLLILDGLELLQHPHGIAEGRLKDAALQALFRSLADQSQGLCIVTTRVHITDLQRHEGKTVPHHRLERLSASAGARILRAQGVLTGSQGELEEASREYDGHPLTLTLLGGLLCDAFRGNIRQRSEIEALTSDVRHGGHARRVMASYANWFGDSPEIRVLRLIGIFDRPASVDAIASVVQPPFIPGLTDLLPEINSVAWRQKIATLRRAGLLLEESPSTPDTIDAHPLVREYFGEELRESHPEAWKNAHRRIFEHLAASAPEYPETQEDMVPLYAAVTHACCAGEFDSALDILYDRINRSEEGYSIKRHHAFGATLSALSCFFKLKWSSPIPELPREAKTWVLGVAGLSLTTLGRFDEASTALKVGLTMALEQKDWSNAAATAVNLAECYTAIGKFKEALSAADQSVKYSGWSRDRAKQVIAYSQRGAVLHRLGRLAEAQSAFERAHQIQKRFDPSQYLYSVRGYKYTEFLLSLGRLTDAYAVAANLLKTASLVTGTLGIALGHLALGRVYLANSAHLTCVDNAKDLATAREHIESALEQMRRIEDQEYLVYGLLTRAECYRVIKEPALAELDVDEALVISESCRMLPSVADCKLEFTKIYLVLGEYKKAANALQQSQALVHATEYHLRERDLEKLAAILSL
jgi:tetratricopeptide (TPR) repeat protein